MKTIQNFKEKSLEIIRSILRKVKEADICLLSLFKRRPFFFVILFFALLLFLIVLGNVIRKRKIVHKEVKKPAILVDVYRIGEAPRVKAQAYIEKENVVKIAAQTSGVVQQIYAWEGKEVYRGKSLAYISTNYQGGNVFLMQRQIAQKQYENIKGTYSLQKELIKKQKEVALKKDVNADELRLIAEKSIDETKSLISLDEDIIAKIDSDLDLYEATNSGGINDEAIFQTKQLKTSFLAALNQLKVSLRNSEYQADGNNPPAILTDLQKEITLKQLELQEKSLDLSKEISYLQYSLARINESLSYPASPLVNGTVERVHIRKGQIVVPGTVLFTIKGCDKMSKATVFTSKKMAESISQLEPARFYLKTETLELMPAYISKEATKGTLYSIKFIIPEDIEYEFTDGEYVEVSLPIGYADTGATIPFIPIDSVYESSEGSFVFVAEDGLAKSRQVHLGEVYGQFVLVAEGLFSSDKVILDRNIVENDTVEVSDDG